MLLGTVHCMFLLSCFGQQLTGGAYELICPSGCDCYTAAADGISLSSSSTSSSGSSGSSGNNLSSVSVVCDRPEPLYSYTSFRWRAINTLVLRRSALTSPHYSPIARPHRALSLVIEQCTLSSSLPVDPQKNLFQLISRQTLRYLTVVDTVLEGIDWTVLSQFNHLRAIYIESSRLTSLDATFSAILSPDLHTLSIKNCGLEYIDREALVGKEASLGRLALTGGRLSTLIWLQSTTTSWTRLWYLDLRDNQLSHLPETLRTSLPNLEVLYLANNPLKYLSPASLEPLFSLSELMLAVYSSSSSGGVKNRIYYTEEMQGLKNMLTMPSPAYDYFPAFFLESLKETLHYDCMLSKNDPSPTLEQFGKLADCDFPFPLPHVYNYWPDNLHFNHQGLLIEGKPVNSGENLKVVSLEGTDLNAYLSSLDQPELFIDSISSMEDYRAARETVLALLSDTMAGNAVRLNLFGPVTFAYLAQPASVVHSAATINLWMDFIEDVLSSAQALDKYLMLVIFRYSDFDFQSGDINFADTESWLVGKLGGTLNQLAARVDANSALVGIEVVSGFLSKELTLSLADEPSAANDCHGASIEVQLRSVHSVAALLKSKLKDKLLGINIDASCRFCLHCAMLPACQKTSISLASPKKYQLDFISLSSKLSDLPAEIYSHRNWPSREPQFFKDIVLEVVPQDAGRPVKPGVFFLLKDDGQGLNVLEAKSEIAAGNFAAGVMVLPLKSPTSASADLLGETIVRQKKK